MSSESSFGLMQIGLATAVKLTPGVSQPYLFRLFGTKKELYVEVVRRSGVGVTLNEALHA